MSRASWFGLLPFLGADHPEADEGPQGLVLAGGGSRASFQLGALHYLYERAGIAPTLISGTSAGAIVGAILAQSMDAKEQSRALFELEALWLGMDGPSEMFTEQHWFSTLRKRAPEVLRLIDVAKQAEKAEPAQPGAGVGPDESTMVLRMAVTEEPAHPLDWTPSLFLQVLNHLPRLGRASGELATALLAAERSQALYRPGPVITGLLGLLDPQRVRTSGMQLRLSMVGLDSGELRFMREDGRIVDRDDHLVDDTEHPLSAGVLASCSIPGIFKPVCLGDEAYLDGGVRENVPVEMGVAHLGMTRPLVILTAPSGVRGEHGYLRRDVVSILSRATTVMMDESERDEVAYARSSGAVVIGPEIAVHEMMDVDPGLLQINRDYGWMRAAETIRNADQHQEQLHREIIQARRRAWELEKAALTPQAVQDGSALTATKRKVRQLLAECDPDLLPPLTEVWWQRFEAHSSAVAAGTE